VSKALRLLLAILACYRLGQLVAVDDGPGFVFARLREWADGQARHEQELGFRRSGRESLSDGLHCPFCVGMWAAGLLALLVARPVKAGDFILTALGIAGAQAWLEEHK
jgi:hypothetical protein